ncbi:MAG: hypothetical protein U9Q62_02115 [Campylobacterota bacterium]|nr:hypothetical protein [Campylobacterota bacterium]
MRVILFIIALSLLLDAKNYVREYTYNASENDSKVSARKAALSQLKLLLIEEVGVQVRSSYFKEQSLDGEEANKVIRDKFESFSQAIAKTKILEEKWNGESFYIKAEVDVDPDAVGESFDELISEKKNPKNVCERKIEKIEILLKDLSTKKKVDAVVTEAVKHPFTVNCFDFHETVMRTLYRLKIDSETYRTFLFETLKKIEFPPKESVYPTSHDLAYSIIRHLKRHGGIRQEEWPVIFKLYKQSDRGTTRSFNHLILDENNPNFRQYQDAILKSAKKGEIGLPTKFSFAEVAFNIFQSLKLHKSDDFEKLYKKTIHKFDEKSQYELFEILLSRYYKEPTESRFNQLIVSVNSFEPSEKLNETLWSFIRKMSFDVGKGKASKTDLDELIKKTSKKTAEVFPLTTIRSQRIDRIEFLIKHNIASSMVPTAKECGEKLFDDHWHERQLHAKYLSLMGERAKPAEQAIIKKLRKMRLKDGDYTTMKALIATLGNIRTTDQKAWEILHATYPSSKGLHNEISQTFIMIGPGAYDTLIKDFDKNQNYIQHQIMNVLTTFKSKKKEVMAFYRKEMKRTPYNKLYIEDAMERLQEE